ncbi:protein of unknown function [Methylorubrum extorquens]|uniref:Uncharacterized protein n=1 Tax=Methylorubrum extorquens TaxID=408 RepID=A0A2N9AU68_METEX|nr:protein of unknown function [Methylorubrum extorquens]
MKAVGFHTSLPIENEAALVDFDLPTPGARPPRPARPGSGGLGESGRY